MMYHDRLCEVISQNRKEIDFGIIKLTKLIESIIEKKRNIWVIGNGGSSSSAEHFETDLSLIRYTDVNIKINVQALTANSSLITATANDLSFTDIFASNLKRRLSKKDLLIAISASGNSPNIIRAVELASELGAVTFGLVGFNGGTLKSKCDNNILVMSNLGEYEIVEDIHLSILHAVKLELIRSLGLRH